MQATQRNLADITRKDVSSQQGFLLILIAIAIFHEGMKGWNCCSKRVISFDDFLKIPGCATGMHTDTIKDKKEPKIHALSSPSAMDGKTEVYGNVPSSNEKVQPEPTVKVETKKSTFIEENDPDDFQPKSGMNCKRSGCKFVFQSQQINTSCTYHPGNPVFHEVFSFILSFSIFPDVPGIKGLVLLFEKSVGI